MKETRVAPGLIEVVRTARPSASVARLTFTGERLASFTESSAGRHIKLFFPRSGQSVPVLPTLSPEGRPIWPAASERPITRTYSVRRFDTRTGELDVDFVLHAEPGPASRWAEHAGPGDRLGLAGPGGPDPMLGAADFYLFAGDLSALPAISALLPSVPATARAHVVLEVEDDVEALLPTAAARVSLEQVRRARYTQSATPDAALVSAVRDVAWPVPNERGFAWVAGESSAVVAIREHLRGERGLAREQLYSVPYWKRHADEEAYHAERHRIMDAMELA